MDVMLRCDWSVHILDKGLYQVKSSYNDLNFTEIFPIFFRQKQNFTKWDEFEKK